jgi:hypothetical protein
MEGNYYEHSTRPTATIRYKTVKNTTRQVAVPYQEVRPFSGFKYSGWGSQSFLPRDNKHEITAIVDEFGPTPRTAGAIYVDDHGSQCIRIDGGF